VIWIEHVVRALTAVVDRLVCLAGGSFIGDGRPAEVLANPAVREVFLGTEVTTSLAGPPGPSLPAAPHPGTGPEAGP
jgi:energy-coupling factor transporter ATP-binding protein EcfA2